MGILSGNPIDEPMHYGEVFSIWTYLKAAKGRIAKYQTLLNHTGDEDLKAFIEDYIENGTKPQIEQLEGILKANGVALPPAPPERPHATLESIPVGARFNDPEIAATVAKHIASGLIACSTIIGQSIREDIALMFAQFHTTKLQYAGRMLRLKKEKAWLVPPPLHTKVPEQD